MKQNHPVLKIAKKNLKIMSFFNNLIDKSKIYLKNVDQNRLVNRDIPIFGGVSYLLLSTEFTTPNIFSK